MNKLEEVKEETEPGKTASPPEPHPVRPAPAAPAPGPGTKTDSAGSGPATLPATHDPTA
jgi:hypothetical protein